MSRLQLSPSPTNLLRLVGDTHHGGLVVAKAAKALAALSAHGVTVPDMYVHVGDIAEDGSNATHRSTATTWLSSLNAPWKGTLGNHDINNNQIAPATVASAYGLATSSYVYDRSYARLIFLYPEPFYDTTNHPAVIWLSQTTLDFLAAALSGTSLPCLIVCHAPLYQTVHGSQTTGYDSFSANDFHVLGPNQTDDTQIRTVLNASANAKAWICGHTHTEISTSGFITTVNLGTRSIVHVNCSSIHYVGTIGISTPDTTLKQTFSPMVMVDMNVMPNNTFEIRYPDLGAGVWTGPTATTRVTTVAIPA